MSDATNKQEPSNESGAESVDRARRRLLGMAVYVPPTVLGIISLQQAGCQPSPSCNPSTCNPGSQPCNPDSVPCPPNSGCNPDSCPPAVGCNPSA
ncbi:MAG TPA: hypothetical protein VKZ63_04155 [Kofleriaceae bacterium]|nr:hypothetical protein [Kofleriaceae bacterium]